jgi:hypothetical protein
MGSRMVCKDQPLSRLGLELTLFMKSDDDIPPGTNRYWNRHRDFQLIPTH